jgi:hypothetical protein
MKKVSNRWLLIGFLGALCSLAAGGSLAADKASTPTVGSSAQTAAPQEKASIQFTESTFSFGEALEGAEVSHDFVVKNAGNAVLQIEQVRPG